MKQYVCISRGGWYLSDTKTPPAGPGGLAGGVIGMVTEGSETYLGACALGCHDIESVFKPEACLATV